MILNLGKVGLRLLLNESDFSVQEYKSGITFSPLCSIMDTWICWISTVSGLTHYDHSLFFKQKTSGCHSEVACGVRN